MMHKKRTSILSLLLCAALVLSGTMLFADAKDSAKQLNKETELEIGFFDGNNIFTYLENDGTVVTDDFDGNSGMYWPSRASLQTINYASGVWVAGLVDGAPVTACAEFTSEWLPGVILPDGTPDNFNASVHRLYKINKADALDPEANEDWMNWPVQYGAPWVDVNENGVYEPLIDHPDMMGDQMIWYVMNDANPAGHTNLFNTSPIGIESRVTIWGYNRPDEFGDMLFVKFQLYNKLGNTVEDCYLGLFDDVDLGDSSDDYVGCDTTLDLGYTYNDGADGVYGAACPAIGYDFFQGALVEGEPGDSAKAFGQKWYGYKNLGMNTFAKYMNGGGATFGDPETPQECYNYMSGLARDGSYFDNNGVPVYPLRYAPGDPVAGTGWLDAQDHPSSDRRMLLTCGPFTLAAGDSQEVVAGMIIGAGSDHLASITRLKQASAKAQVAYDIDFQLPETPGGPIVQAVGLDGAVVLKWDNAQEDYEAIDMVDMDDNGDPTYYEFQGYNVYQLETDRGVGVVKKIATYDLIDLVQDIQDFQFVGSLGENVEITVQDGKDTGLQHHHYVNADVIRSNAAIVNNRPYYFAVSAYGYNPEGVPKALEGPKTIVEVYPQDRFGERVNAEQGTMLDVEHSGISLGGVTVEVVDPLQVTGHNYSVTFEETADGTVWNLNDLTANTVALAGQMNQTGDHDYEIVDGLLVKVLGPDPGIDWDNDVEGWDYDGTRWVSGHDWGGRGLFGGLDDGLNFWGVTAGRYVNTRTYFYADPGPDSSNWSKAYVIRRDKGYALEGLGWFPGKTYNVQVDPPEQLNMAFVEDDRIIPANNLWDMGWMPDSSKYVNDGDGAREYLWFLDSPYDVTNQDLLNADWYDGSTIGLMYAIWPSQRGSHPYLEADFTLDIFAAQVNGVNDVFTFSTAGMGLDASAAYSKSDIEKINVFPNPYFGGQMEEIQPLDRFVRFTHLPDETPATIRIFTLSGELVRVLEHDNGTQFEEWNLENDESIPVSSGMYIVHVDCGSLGEKILKMAVLMPEERLRQY